MLVMTAGLVPQESRHVFVEAGLRHVLLHFSFTENAEINIFEISFGTGLNALLSLQAMPKKSPFVIMQ